MAENFWTNFDTLPALAEFSSELYPGLKAKQIDWEGKTANISIGVIPGLTQEIHKDFRDNITDRIKLLSDEASMEDLDPEEGYRIVYQAIKMPMLCSNRSVIIAQGEKQNEDGSIYVVATSRGTEALQEKHSKKIGSNVIAT